MRIKTFANNAPTINQTQQLIIHSILGCGIGAGMSGGASGCSSGALAGVVGELVADSFYQGGNGTFGNTNQARQIAVSAGGLSGSVASLFTSIALGDDDNKIAKNIYAGNFLATNAGANNALKFKEVTIFPYPKKDYDLNVGVQYSLGPITISHGTDGVGASANSIPSLSVAGYINFVPSGENSEVGLSYGIKDRFTADFIATNKGNFGFGFTGGFSIAPPILVNSSVNLKFDN